MARTVARPRNPFTRACFGSNVLDIEMGPVYDRVVVKINYPYRVVYIRFVGTHAEYDGIDAEEV